MLCSLDRLLTHSETMNIGIRIIDFLTFPRESGDCVVLLLAHPGLNLLGRYFPPRKVNDILLADTSGAHSNNSSGDIHMLGLDEAETHDEMEVFDVMDLASFIEYGTFSLGHSSQS